MADLFVIHRLVDRILRQQKADREAAEKARADEKAKAEARLSLLSKPPELAVQDTQKTKIPTAQTKLPSSPATGTAIAAPPPPPPPPTPGSTGLEQASKRSRPTSAIQELGRFLRPNRSDVSSSQAFQPPSPPKSEAALPPSNPVSSRRDASPLPNSNVPEGPSLSAKPRSSRPIVRSQQPGTSITPLSNIGMSLESDISVFSSRAPFYSQ